MATDLQKKALEALVEAGRTKKRIIKGQVLVKAGYSKKTAIAPDKVFKSKGFLDLCDEIGLTESFLTQALVFDIRNKPKRRHKELELGFKVRGTIKESERPQQQNNFFFLNDEQQQRIARRLIAGDKPSEN